MQTDSYVNELRQLMKCEDATKLETLPTLNRHTHTQTDRRDRETGRQDDFIYWCNSIKHHQKRVTHGSCTLLSSPLFPHGNLLDPICSHLVPLLLSLLASEYSPASSSV